MLIANLKANSSLRIHPKFKTLLHGTDFSSLSELIQTNESVIIATTDMVFNDEILELMNTIHESDKNYGIVYSDYNRTVDGYTMYINNISYKRDTIVVPMFGSIFSNDCFAEVVEYIKTVEKCSIEDKLPCDLKLFSRYNPYHIPLPGYSI